jgi:hypothetical protein
LQLSKGDEHELRSSRLAVLLVGAIGCASGDKKGVQSRFNRWGYGGIPARIAEKRDCFGPVYAGFMAFYVV